MKWILLLSTLILCAITAHAGDYDDCVLKGMKGVSSDVGARLVAEACRNKVKENAAKEAKQESFGSELNKSEYKFGSNVFESHDGGYISWPLRNTSSSKTLTYVKLTIKDGDYYDYKEIIIWPPKSDDTLSIFPDYSFGSERERERLTWESERTSTYFYKLFLRPGKVIRLMFPKPRTDSCYAEITTALGRAAKWTDAGSILLLSDKIKPEPRDPLE